MKIEDEEPAAGSAERRREPPRQRFVGSEHLFDLATEGARLRDEPGEARDGHHLLSRGGTRMISVSRSLTVALPYLAIVLAGIVMGVLLTWALPTALAKDANAAGTAIPQATAIEVARQHLSSQDPNLKGLKIGEARRQDAVRSATDSAGRVVYTGEEAKNIWIIQFTGSPDAEFANVEGTVVLEASTGRVLSSEILKNNE